MQVRSTVTLVLGVTALLAAAGSLEAQTATQVVRFRVLPASRAAVAPVKTPLSMRDGKRSAAETKYAIATTESNRKLVVSLDRALPGGVSLTIALTPPPGAMTAGPVVLDTVATDLLTSIPVSAENGLPVRYTLSSGADSAPASPEDRTVVVTYTVTEQPD